LKLLTENYGFIYTPFSSLLYMRTSHLAMNHSHFSSLLN